MFSAIFVSNTMKIKVIIFSKSISWSMLNENYILIILNMYITTKFKLIYWKKDSSFNQTFTFGSGMFLDLCIYNKNSLLY